MAKIKITILHNTEFTFGFHLNGKKIQIIAVTLWIVVVCNGIRMTKHSHLECCGLWGERYLLENGGY